MIRNWTMTAAIVSTLCITGLAADPESNRPVQRREAKKVDLDVSARGIHVKIGANDRTISHVFRSDKLIGMTVRNSEGKDLGAVEDLVLDFGDGNVRYAAISFGGFLGLGEKLFAVPLNALALDFDSKAEQSFIIFDVTKEKLDQAPGFNSDHWPDVADAKWSAEIDKFYGVTVNDTKVGVTVENRDGTAERPKSPATTVTPNSSDRQIIRASMLEGVNVRNSKAEDLATVEDLIIDAQAGAMTHVIITQGATLGVGGRMIAVPRDSVTLKYSGTNNERELILPMTEEKLKKAPQLPDQWPNLNDDNWSLKFDQFFAAKSTEDRN